MNHIDRELCRKAALPVLFVIALMVLGRYWRRTCYVIWGVRLLNNTPTYQIFPTQPRTNRGKLP